MSKLMKKGKVIFLIENFAKSSKDYVLQIQNSFATDRHFKALF